MLRFRAPLYVVAALVLAGCGEQVNAGTVVDKDFEPAHEETYYQQVQTGQVCSGQPPICTPIYTQIPVTSWQPDEWRLRIEGCKAKKDDFERRDCEKKDRRWVTVGENTHDRTKVGGWFEAR